MRLRELLQEGITKHIRSTIPETMKREKYKNVSDINVGSCADFAYDVAQKCFKDKLNVKMMSGPGHTWLKHNNKHYDAQSPNGVNHPSHLHFYRNPDNFREKRKLVKRIASGE